MALILKIRQLLLKSSSPLPSSAPVLSCCCLLLNYIVRTRWQAGLAGSGTALVYTRATGQVTQLSAHEEASSKIALGMVRSTGSLHACINNVVVSVTERSGGNSQQRTVCLLMYYSISRKGQATTTSHKGTITLD